MPRGTIRGTVLIETIVAAFEMDEVDLLPCEILGYPDASRSSMSSVIIVLA